MVFFVFLTVTLVNKVWCGTSKTCSNFLEDNSLWYLFIENNILNLNSAKKYIYIYTYIYKNLLVPFFSFLSWKFLKFGQSFLIFINLYLLYGIFRSEVKKTCLYLLSTTDPFPLPSPYPQKKRRNGNSIIKVLKWNTMTDATIKLEHSH